MQNFNHQPKQLQLAKEVDSIARSRYNTTVEAFIQGKMDILNLERLANFERQRPPQLHRADVHAVVLLLSNPRTDPLRLYREPTAGGTVSDLTDPFF